MFILICQVKLAPKPMNTPKDIATNFLRMVIEGNIDQAYSQYVSPTMRHHNMHYPGDAQSLQKGMAESHENLPHKKLETKRVIAEGDTVAVHSHFRMQEGDIGFAVVHIFKIANDQIVEMWDIVQQIPEDSPNENGAF